MLAALTMRGVYWVWLLIALPPPQLHGRGPVHEDADLLRQPHHQLQWPCVPSGLRGDRLLLHLGALCLQLLVGSWVFGDAVLHTCVMHRDESPRKIVFQAVTRPHEQAALA